MSLRALAFLLLTASLAAQPVRKVDILFVGAHPDDDSCATATLARYVSQGRRVAVITATRGEQGGNRVGPERGSALGLLREGEERAALGQLGIETIYYLNRIDSGFTTSLQVSQANWGRAKVLTQLVRYLRYLQPAVVITMNPGPRGHGDHQLIAQLTSEAFFHAAEGGEDREGLRPWRASKLYYALEYGADGLTPSLTVPTGPFGEQERQALALYRSQGWHLNNMPVQPAESFLLAASQVPVAIPEQDMLAGLEAEPGRRVRPLPPPALELERTPALQRFLEWSRRFGLALAVLAPPTRVAEPGQWVRWPVRSSRGPTPPPAIFQAPARPGRHTLPHPLGPVTLQVVPRLQLVRQQWSAWQPVASVWEGTDHGDRARFRLRLTADRLDYQVQARDDQVLADLPASENRAHWRTDSVELCLDPSGTSAHNKTTFKLGIVVRNRQGTPMAARDADARPGPWPHPVRGVLTRGGYRLEGSIPLGELPGPLQANFGCNVLMYDNDSGKPSCRLAWSAFETVQGWPELWGRVHVR